MTEVAGSPRFSSLSGFDYKKLSSCPPDSLGKETKIGKKFYILTRDRSQTEKFTSGKALLEISRKTHIYFTIKYL
jgi:hypothetical protein